MSNMHTSVSSEKRSLSARLSQYLPERPFDREMTTVCKGAAILLLLCHHLFLSYPVNAIKPLCLVLGVSGKLCVGIFLLLSGYGLARARCEGHFIRLVRLLFNFWAVALPFILLSCLFTKRTFAVAYPDGSILHFATDMLGLTTGYGGFNPTWWFMGVIVPLYIVYPLLRRLADVSRVGIVLLSVIVATTGVRYGEWGLPFVFGMLLGRTDVLERLTWKLTALDGILMSFALVILMGVRYETRLIALLEPFYAFAFVLALYAIRCLSGCRFAGFWTGLAFVGRHSMNVFLLHTFLFVFFFRDFFLSLNPVFGLVILLMASLACSMLIEGCKRLMRFDRFLDLIRRLSLRTRPAGT